MIVRPCGLKLMSRFPLSFSSSFSNYRAVRMHPLMRPPFTGRIKELPPVYPFRGPGELRFG